MFVEEEERVKIDIYSNAISTHLWWESGITAARSKSPSGYERLKFLLRSWHGFVSETIVSSRTFQIKSD